MTATDMAAPPQLVGRSEFDRWLWERDVSNIAAAGVLGVAVESVRRYRLPLGHADYRSPRPPTIRLIHDWTAGEVTFEHFEPARRPTPVGDATASVPQ